jgi:hypothetical protein
MSDKTAFIVVGTRGRGAFTSALLGSVSNEIVRAARCPVVVVPPAVDAADAPRDHSDGSADASAQVGTTSSVSS